jgi:hypothetical protein
VRADTFVHFEDKLSDEMQVAVRMHKNFCGMLFARLSDGVVTLILFANTAAGGKKRTQAYEVSPKFFYYRFDDLAE